MKQGVFLTFGLSLTTLMVSLLIGGFFYVGGVAAQSPRPDLKITTATFDGGRNLHVEYINATGVAYPKTRYEVGFQWYDATGKPVGVRRWFPVPEVARGGVTIVDPSYQRIELSYRASGNRILGEQLLFFLRGRPDAATELRVTVDDGDRVAESDERNNVAVLSFAQPDIQIQNAKLLPGNRLQFEFQNVKPATIANQFQIGFTWVDDAGKTLAATRHLSALATLPGVQKVDSTRKTETSVSFLSESGQRGTESLQWYLERRPAQATQLKISMDDTQVVTESNEQNNVALLRVALPDFVVRDAKFVNGKLSFVYGNIGDGRISDSATRLLFQWRDLAGKPAGEPRWYRFAQMDAKQMIPVDPERFNVEYAVSGTTRAATERLATYLSQRPHNATHMSIVIDDEQRIVEANEANNGENVTPPPLPLPDLALATASFVSPTRLSVSYQNLSGTPVTGSVRMGFVWANENGNPLTFSRWMNVRAPSVNAVETIDVSRTDVSYTNAQGQRIDDRLDIYLEQRPVDATRFIVTIDDDGAIRESNEQNNSVRLRPSIPDLEMVEAVWNEQGLAVTFRNASDAAVGAPFLWFHFADARGTQAGRIAWWDGPPIAGGSVQTIRSRDLTFGSERGLLSADEFLDERPRGASHLKILVDGPARIAESNELNNTALVAIPKESLPDLAVTNLTWTKEGVSFAASNQGAGAARGVGTKPLSYWFEWVDGRGTRVAPLYWMDIIEGMKPGVETRMTAAMFAERTLVRDGDGVGVRGAVFLEDPPRQATHLKVTVDGPNVIKESNDSNNSANVKRPQPLQPDLTVTELSVKQAAITWTERNDGDASGASGAYTTRLEWVAADGTVLGRHEEETAATDASARIGVLKRGELSGLKNTPLTFRIAPAGAAKLRATIDAKNAISESNEQNNVMEVDAPRPDLTFTKIYVPSQYRWLSISYKNQSTDVAAPAFPWSMYWADASGKRVGDAFEGVAKSAVAWGAGAMATEAGTPAGTWLAQPKPVGAKRLEFVLDPENKVAETNESNNKATFEGWVPEASIARYDFAIESAEIVGDDSMKILIQNAGELKLTQPLSVWFEWVDEKDQRVGDFYWFDEKFSTNMSLSPRQRWLLPLEKGHLPVLWSKSGPLQLKKFLEGVPATAKHLKIRLDGPNTFAEHNEEDNVKRVSAPKPYRAPAPDLTIETGRVSGDSLSYTIRNVGTAEFRDFLTTKYEWMDANGVLVGESYGTLEKNVRLKDDEKKDVKITRYTNTEFSTIREGHAWRVRDHEFFELIPTRATQLRMTVDSQRLVDELNENNNAIVLDLPKITRPDLTIEQLTLKERALSFRVANVGDGDFFNPIPLWFEWVDGQGSRIGDLFWHDYAMTRIPVGSYRDFSIPASDYQYGTTLTRETPQGRRTVATNSLLKNPPAGATHLKVTVDGPNRYVEVNEENNSARVVHPEAITLPDLSLTGGLRVGGVVTMTIVNGTPNALSTPLLQFKWLDANGATLGTSPVSYWSGATIASGKTGEFKIEYERWREDGVTYFLKHPPEGSVALLVTIDPENKLKESNEDNNTFRIEIGGQPDIVSGGDSSIRNGVLIVPVKNAGTAASVATDAWIQWTGGGKWLEGVGGFDVPALQPGETKEISVPLDTTFRADGRILRDIPVTAERLRVFLDGARKVEESNEDNNSVMLQRSLFPKAVAKEITPLPDIAFTSVLVPRGDDFLVIGFQNAGKGELGTWEWQIQWQDENGRMLGDTYRHGHAGLKPGWRFGLRSDVKERDVTGKKSLDAFLKSIPLRATHIEITLDPENVIKESSESNNVQRFEVADFPPSLKKKPETKKTEQKPEIKPEPKPEPKPEITPTGDPDLTIDGMGLLSDDLVTAANAPYTADFFGTVKNTGAVPAPAAHARLRLDVGNDGTWDITLPTSSALDVIPAGDYTTAQWRVTWRAPLGAYAFEICVDHENKIKEKNESNNCQADQFTFVVGQEPMFEEEGE